MAYWLLKSEPGSYSWADLVRDGSTWWDGVRNNAARLHLRSMQPGDEALFYHSGAEKAVVGMVRIGAEEWRAVAADDEPIPAGTHVTVREIKGTRAVVEPVD